MDIDLIIKIIISFLGGFLPAILWLWFWIKQDNKNPEPKKIILKTFLYGGLMVPITFVFQKSIDILFFGGKSFNFILYGGISSFIVLFIMATIEEFLKFSAASGSGLKDKENDEPLDFSIYMVTAALGFSAFENILYIFSQGSLSLMFDTSITRSLGATLLHVSSSGIIGIFGSFSYFYKKEIKNIYIFYGFSLAILLHTLFNLFIIKSNNLEKIGYFSVWAFVMMVLVLFEKIKKIKISKIKNV